VTILAGEQQVDGRAWLYRFGARTGTAPVLIGAVFVFLGVSLGDSGYALLRMIPSAVLGVLLLSPDSSLRCRRNRKATTTPICSSSC